MSWKMMAAGRNYPDNIEQELEAAYKEGCEDGYQKAMEEMEGSQNYGERRNEGSYPMYGERRGSGSGYGERGSYGERRGVPGTGRRRY